MKITDISGLLLPAESARAEDLTKVYSLLQETFPEATIKIEGNTTLKKFISINKDSRRIFVLLSKKGMIEVKEFNRGEVPVDTDWTYHLLSKRQTDAEFENVEDFLIGLKNVLT